MSPLNLPLVDSNWVTTRVRAPFSLSRENSPRIRFCSASSTSLTDVSMDRLMPVGVLRVEPTHQRAAFPDAPGERPREFRTLSVTYLQAQYGLQIAILADEPLNSLGEVAALRIEVQLQAPGDLAVDLLDAQSQFAVQFCDQALALVPHNLRVYIALGLSQCQDADPQGGDGKRVSRMPFGSSPEAPRLPPDPR